jgi:hypothetical protein
MPERGINMDLLYAMRDLGVADPAADSTGEQTVRAALAREIDTAPAARQPSRARRTRPGLLAGATGLVAASATAVTLLVTAAAAPPPAFAVTRHHDGSVSVKVNRPTSIATVNHMLAAMGIERISTRAMAAGENLSSIPSCSSIPAGWKGEWVQMAGSSSGPGYSISESVAPGTWVLIMCTATNPHSTGSGASGNPGSGNTGAG